MVYTKIGFSGDNSPIKIIKTPIDIFKEFKQIQFTKAQDNTFKLQPIHLGNILIQDTKLDQKLD